MPAYNSKTEAGVNHSTAVPLGRPLREENCERGEDLVELNQCYWKVEVSP